jgi:hypothetical protein
MAKKTSGSATKGRPKTGSAPARASQRKLTPIQAANEVVTHTRLERVRFSGFSAHARMAIEEVDIDARLRASTNFRTPSVDSAGDGQNAGFKATSTLVFRLDAPAPSSEQRDESEPCVVVKATLEASYAFKDDSPDFADEQLRTFALHYCPFHVWGYWREFVHSSLARLEFPPLTVPLFRIDMAQAFVVDEVD